MKKQVARHIPMHLIFVDLHKAYDNVPLKKLCVKYASSYSHMASISEDLYKDAVKNMYIGCTSRKIVNSLSENFVVRKGDSDAAWLLPTLFKIYSDKALKKWKRKCSSICEIIYCICYCLPTIK